MRSLSFPLKAPIRRRPPAPGRRRRGLLYLHEAGALLRVAAPIILAQLGGVGMNTMDTIMVGPLGAESLAAAGLATALHVAVLLVCMGILLGMSPLVAQGFGARDLDSCRRVLVQGLWLGAIVSLPVFAFNLVGGPVADALGQQPVVAELVGGYMGALAWGVLPVILFVAFRQYIEGMGLTRPAMVITFLGLGINYLGNRALIYGIEGWVPAMGVVGSGWATTIVRWAMLAAMVFYVVRHPRLKPFLGTGWRPEGTMLRRILGIGWPAGVQLGMEVGLFSFAAVMMGWFGAVELGAHQVTMNIASTTFMIALGTSLAGTIRVGQHIGAGSMAGVRRTVSLTYVLSLAAMSACALLFLLAPQALLGLYTRDPEILRLGAALLLMAAFFQLFDGAQAAGFCSLRGAADTRVPMLLALISFWVIGVPAAYLLGFHTRLGPVGVWAGLVLALAVAAALLAWRVWRVLWRAPALARVAGEPAAGRPAAPAEATAGKV